MSESAVPQIHYRNHTICLTMTEEEYCQIIDNPKESVNLIF
jgi:hypothetical protein